MEPKEHKILLDHERVIELCYQIQHLNAHVLISASAAFLNFVSKNKNAAVSPASQAQVKDELLLEFLIELWCKM